MDRFDKKIKFCFDIFDEFKNFEIIDKKAKIRIIQNKYLNIYFVLCILFYDIFYNQSKIIFSENLLFCLFLLNFYIYHEYTISDKIFLLNFYNNDENIKKIIYENL